jgi:hypothetical protein
MASLSRDLRRQLEKTIAGENGARQIAEAGAEQSLRRLAVDHHEPHTSLTPEDRTLRNQLRAHGRQLGDKRDPQRGTQTITHLKQAVAYEHWHRMLFARFLAENDLLLHPEHGVALSLDEVKELALGLRRDWIEVAAEYAQRMLLREVFRSDDPSLRVPLPPEKRFDLERKLESLPSAVFRADDSLGWVYQFWQNDAKDRVDANLKAGEKVDADGVPPKTQLFTEDYMVQFLLDNTLGAWWTAKRASPELPGHEWSYLRLNPDGSPCSGSFDTWPRNARELRFLDPCMGSGHFLTFALPVLARMRAVEEHLSLVEAVTAVLRENLFGLELDPRCSQIAAFNLALTAWKLGGGYYDLPPLNLACSGLAINAQAEAWTRLAASDARKQDLMRWLYGLFNNAPTFGSLIDPRTVGKPLVDQEIADLASLLQQAMKSERQSDEDREMAIAAQGLVASAQLLSNQFHLVATNVPYLTSSNQAPLLKEFCSQPRYSLGKSDLATCFLQRCLSFCLSGGTAALVSPQNWLFQPAYIGLRKNLLTEFEWDLLAELGPHAFDTISGEVVKVSLTAITKRPPSADHHFAGINVSKEPDALQKAAELKRQPPRPVSQLSQIANPEHRIVLDGPIQGTLLSARAKSHQGIKTSDDPQFVRKFWELPCIRDGWEFHLSTVKASLPYGGREHILLFESGQGRLRALAKSQDRDRKRDMQGVNAWGKWGVAVSCTGALPVSLYTGEKFDTNVAVVVPEDPEDLAPLYEFCKSPEFSVSVRRIDRSFKITNATLVKVPFERDRWAKLVIETSAAVPPPESSDPTQWLFAGSPARSDNPLHTAVLRLLGYCWPRQTGSAPLGCQSLEPDGLESLAAPDGIVCLPPVAGSDSGAARVREILRAAFGHDHNVQQFLEATRSHSIEDWLRDEFFEEHCRLFHDVPFVWHVWDGLNDGFHALVNYHRLDRKNLEKLVYSYLGDWITRQRQDISTGVEGADMRLPAAEHLQNELKRILVGEVPYDIFVRWKPIAEQPVGWAPDLSDGVRVNIRPWVSAARLYTATKPGILRVTPTFRYTRDPGKEPTHDPRDFPWFKGSTDRINDYHLSLDEKQQARGLA